MKRWLLRLILLVCGFAPGFWLGMHWINRQRTEAKLQEVVSRLQSQTYGSNYLDRPGIDKEADAQLAAFDPSHSECRIELGFSSVWGEQSYQLSGTGEFWRTAKGKRELLITLPPERCKAFFLNMLKGGILNCSAEVIDLKEDLGQEVSHVFSEVYDASTTDIRIFVPSLKIDKAISVYAADFGLEQHPDIIEYKIITDVEKAMLGLVPEKQR